MNVKRGILCILAATTTAGCDPASEGRVLPQVTERSGVEHAVHRDLPPLLDPSHAWALRAVRTVPTSAGGEPTIFDAAAVLPLPDGSILVHDPMADRPLVHLAPGGGGVLRRFGARGKGPGELGPRVLLSLASEGGEYRVYDPANQQVHSYDTDGDWIGSRRMELDGWALELQAAPGGGALLQTLQRSPDGWWNELHVLDGDAAPATEFMTLPTPAPGSEPGSIQKGRVLWASFPGGVVSMWSSLPRFEVHDSAGRLARVVDLPFEARDLTDRDIAIQIERVGALASRLEPGPAALTNMLYPVNDTVVGMFVSSLWGAEGDPELPAEAILWRLFSLRGEYLGWVEQPEDFRFLGPGRGTMWARILDANAEPVIVELELVRAK